MDEEDAEATFTADGKLVKNGVTYGPGDCIFVHPHTFDALEDNSEDTPEVPAYAAKGRFHKGGANAGLRAFGIARIVGLAQAAGKKAKNAERVAPFPFEASSDLSLGALSRGVSHPMAFSMPLPFMRLLCSLGPMRCGWHSCNWQFGSFANHAAAV